MNKYISARCESAVKVVAQRLLICLGDLTRYRANQVQSTDFAEASKYYQRAQELIPGNGAPYNQLAIIAIYNVCIYLSNLIWIYVLNIISNIYYTAQAVRCCVLLYA